MLPHRYDRDSWVGGYLCLHAYAITAVAAAAMLPRSRACAAADDGPVPPLAVDWAVAVECHRNASFCFGDPRDDMNWGPARRGRCPPDCTKWGGWIVQDKSTPSLIEAA